MNSGEQVLETGSSGANKPVPGASVARLPMYLRALQELISERITNVSSERLAEMAGVNAAKVRKDLSYLGSYGTRGVGYDVEYLAYQMNRELGLNKQLPIVIIGAGNLGSALANYGGFDERGYAVVGIFDVASTKVGQVLHGLTVRHLDELASAGRLASGAIGVIATPAAAAQLAADRLMAVGVRSILNFAPIILTHREDVSVRKVDLALELQILSFYQQRGEAPETRSTPTEAPARRRSTADLAEEARRYGSEIETASAQRKTA